MGAVLIGGVTFGLGGWTCGLLLVLFFVTSSALSRFREADKRKPAEAFEKGSRRDLGQVLANGGMPATLALASGLATWEGWLAMFIGALAAATADTWATELGTLSRTPPRLITTGGVVPVGSRAVSPCSERWRLLPGEQPLAWQQDCCRMGSHGGQPLRSV